jgi:hypothetical protein
MVTVGTEPLTGAGTGVPVLVGLTGAGVVVTGVPTLSEGGSALTPVVVVHCVEDEPVVVEVGGAASAGGELTADTLAVLRPVEGSAVVLTGAGVVTAAGGVEAVGKRVLGVRLSVTVLGTQRASRGSTCGWVVGRACPERARRSRLHMRNNESNIMCGSPRRWFR